MKLFYTIILILITTAAFSQGKIEGKVVEAETKTPIVQVNVKLVSPSFERIVQTDAVGNYSFINIRTGNYTLVISEPGFFEISQDIDYVDGEQMVVPDILIEKQQIGKEDNGEVPTVDQTDDGSGGSGSAVASLLNSSRDLFVFNSIMNLSQARFSLRGLGGFINQDQVIMINGIPFENIASGNQVNFNDFNGLNDVLRSRSNYYGIKAIPFTFGELTTNTDVDAEAIYQRKGFRISQWVANRNFTSRTSATYNTGLLKNNFAFSASLNFRGATEGYEAGTAMESYSGFLSASKKWSNKFLTSITAIYTDVTSANSAASTKEFYELAGTNFYNPRWGNLNGYKRNANLRRNNVPSIILSNEYKPSENTLISINAAAQIGKRYQERIDFFEADDPNPTYYRKAPSYAIVYNNDSVLARSIYNTLSSNKNLLQLDWNAMYAANMASTRTVPVNNTVGRWSRYIMSRDVQDVKNYTFNAVIRHQLTNKVTLNGGILGQMNSTTYYKELNDLLGGDFYVNIDSFALEFNPNKKALQNNLLNPFGIVKKGDKYGYHYVANLMNLSTWAQGLITLNKIDAFLAVRAENTSMSREGKFQSGVYENNSLGKSTTKSFTNISVKGGLTYKMNGKNYFSISALRQSNAPLFQTVFIQSEISNKTVDVKSSETISSEISYNHRGARTKIQASAFYTLANNESMTLGMWDEFAKVSPNINGAFGTVLLKNINKRYMGIELGAETKIGNSGFTVMGIASIGDYIYNNRPTSAFYADDLDTVLPEQTVYFNGLHLATGPQIAGSMKVSYNSKQYWMASVSLNYFDKRYTDPSPIRRTDLGLEGVVVNSDQYYKILKQEIIPSAMTVDLFFRKSFMINKYIKSIKKRMYFDLNFNINNVLDKKDLVFSSYEQLRFDKNNHTDDKFPNKYDYMPGRTYMINFIFRM